jgi:type IV pilus assembly protein PilE
MTFRSSRRAGFTLIEVLTALVVVGVIVAIAVPSWRSHLLRARRADGTAALIAVQKAQDEFFGRNARYASAQQLTAPSPGGLGLAETSERGFYSIDLTTSADGLAYRAAARIDARAGQDGDSRCATFSIDEMGQRRATDADGTDRTADCWK